MQPTQAIRTMEVSRTTESGREILCILTDGTNVDTTDIVLRDSLGRMDRATVNDSTALILVSIGELGAIPFDPMFDQKIDGRVVFQQRITLCNLDVRRQLDETLLAMAKKASQEKRVIDAVGAFPKRGF